MGDASMKFDVQAKGDMPPFVDVTDPLGRRYQLLNPAFNPVYPRVNSVTCADAESFAQVVKTVCGGNRLVELRNDSRFHYTDELGDLAINRVNFGLTDAETVSILCLAKDASFSQRALVQWHQQHPETLVPMDEDPAAVWEEVSNFKAKAGTEVSAQSGDRLTAMSIVESSDGGTHAIPVYWTAKSPVFDGHMPFEVTLRLEIAMPRLDENQKQVGELRFNFGLWTPSAAEVANLAMRDASAWMAALLADFTIIRGQIG